MYLLYIYFRFVSVINLYKYVFCLVYMYIIVEESSMSGGIHAELIRTHNLLITSLQYEPLYHTTQTCIWD